MGKFAPFSSFGGGVSARGTGKPDRRFQYMARRPGKNLGFVPAAQKDEKAAALHSTQNQKRGRRRRPAGRLWQGGLA